MKNTLYLLLAVLLCNCAGLKRAQQARRVARAHAVLACYERDTPPDAQLSALLAVHPELEGKTVRIVTERDTVQIPASTVAVSLPATSTTATDNALIDSLLNSAGRNLQRKDSATFAARLRAELSTRPRLSHDTITRVIGPMTLRIWTDSKGRPQAVCIQAVQKVAYEKKVTQTGPVLVKREMTTSERIWLFIKDIWGVLVAALVLVGGVWMWFFVKRQRNQANAA